MQMVFSEISQAVSIQNAKNTAADVSKIRYKSDNTPEEPVPIPN